MLILGLNRWLRLSLFDPIKFLFWSPLEPRYPWNSTQFWIWFSGIFSSLASHSITRQRFNLIWLLLRESMFRYKTKLCTGLDLAPEKSPHFSYVDGSQGNSCGTQDERLVRLSYKLSALEVERTKVSFALKAEKFHQSRMIDWPWAVRLIIWHKCKWKIHHYRWFFTILEKPNINMV